MQDCTIKIIRLGVVLFSSLVFCAAVLIFMTGEFIDPLVSENLIEELMLTAQKISVITTLCAFISDFLTGRKKDRKN